MNVVHHAREGLGVAPACQAVGLPRATYYRRLVARYPRPPRPSPARSLRGEERQAVLELLHSKRFVDCAPAEVQATLLDEGTYLCSTRTMYRILADAHEVCERRRQARHPTYARPELLATAPNQVWSWDITKLRTFEKWTYLYLYVIIDVFSRYVVGWMVAGQESAALAQRLIEEAVARQGINPYTLVIHQDRGGPMKAKTTAQLCADLGIFQSFSRPHVSDDNPYSESQFKTLKYHADFPGRFGTLEESRGFLGPFFDWYNDEHRHAGIAMHTPASVHFGQATWQREQRQRVLVRAFAQHPERFVKGLASPPELPKAVWINKPREEQRPTTSPSAAKEVAASVELL
jgi:putative transposase